MTLSYSSIGSHAAASGTSPASVTTTAALNVGDFLVVVFGYDNSGTSGADPLTAGVTASPASGSLGTASSGPTAGLNDPGAASAGIAFRCVAYPVTATIASGTVISLAWTGTAVVRAAQLVKVTSSVGKVAFNSLVALSQVVASTTASVAFSTVTTGQLVLAFAGHEYGEAVTGDSDTTNGSWGSVLTANNGSTTSGIGVGVQGKAVTAGGAQTCTFTGTSSDWVAGGYIFDELATVTATRATTWNVAASKITKTFYNNSGTFFVTTPASITGVAWAKDDVIIVIGGTEDATGTLPTPTNANLTFTPISGATLTTGAGVECPIQFWQAIAGSAQTAQTIAVGSAGGKRAGICAYVCTGGGAARGAATSRNESAMSATVGDGSLVIHASSDFSATSGYTPATGSGTATERVDVGDGTSWGFYVADWADVAAGTSSFGRSSYAGTTVTQGLIEIPVAIHGITTYAQVTSNGTGATGSVVSGSITPADGDVVRALVWCGIDDAGSTSTTTLSVADSGWTKSVAWRVVGRIHVPMPSVPTQYSCILEEWACQIATGGGGVAGTITVSRSSSAGGRSDVALDVACSKHAGGDVPVAFGGAGANQGSNSGASVTTLAANLGAPPDVNSAVFGGAEINTFNAVPQVTQPTGFTKASEWKNTTFGSVTAHVYRAPASVPQNNSFTFATSSADGVFGLLVEYPIAAPPAAGGGTTPVTNSVGTTWNVAAQVTSTRATTWNTVATVTATRATTWNALAKVTAATRATTWNALASATSTRATTWTVAGRITSTRATTWNVAASVAATRATTWTVLTSVGAVTRATTWSVAAAVTATRATTWTVIGPVTATRATTWNVLATAASTRATTWIVRAAVTSTRDTTWNTRAAVAASRPTTWSVLTSVAVTRSTTWRVLVAVTSTRATTWFTDSNLNLVTVTATRSTTWNASARVTQALATTWTVRTPVAAATRSTTWAVLASVTSSHATIWTVRATVASTRASTWDTLARLAAATRSTTWTVRTPVAAATRSTTWTVRSLVLGSRATTWDALAKISPATRATTWTSATSLTATRSTQWAVRVLVTATRSTQWKVLKFAIVDIAAGLGPLVSVEKFSLAALRKNEKFTISNLESPTHVSDFQTVTHAGGMRSEPPVTIAAMQAAQVPVGALTSDPPVFVAGFSPPWAAAPMRKDK